MSPHCIFRETMKGGDDYCPCYLANEETEAQRKHLASRGRGAEMTEPGFPPLQIIGLPLFSVQTTRVSSISGEVLQCKHGTSEGDRSLGSPGTGAMSWNSC